MFPLEVHSVVRSRRTHRKKFFSHFLDEKSGHIAYKNRNYNCRTIFGDYEGFKDLKYFFLVRIGK